jgi:hypothetical protein
VVGRVLVAGEQRADLLERAGDALHREHLDPVRALGRVVPELEAELVEDGRGLQRAVEPSGAEPPRVLDAAAHVAEEASAGPCGAETVLLGGLPLVGKAQEVGEHGPEEPRGTEVLDRPRPVRHLGELGRTRQQLRRDARVHAAPQGRTQGVGDELVVAEPPCQLERVVADLTGPRRVAREAERAAGAGERPDRSGSSGSSGRRARAARSCSKDRGPLSPGCHEASS